MTDIIRDPSGMPDAKVPCDGCTACCRGGIIIVHPDSGDDPSTYETESIAHPESGDLAHRLKTKPNGDCIYLDRAEGCTIHERRPKVCRVFDCRQFLLQLRSLPRRERRFRLAASGKQVLRAGKERLHTLEDT